MPGCKIFETEDESKCMEAYSGYYIDNGEIKQYEKNCEECSLVEENENKILKCTKVKDGYFIGREGKIKSCNDKDEGIAHCESCKTEPNHVLTCISWFYNYNRINGECKSNLELYPIEGCIYIEKNYRDYKYYCMLCDNNYILV